MIAVILGVVADILSWILLLSGSCFAVVGALGVIRMPDLFTRMHGAGITDTLGAGLILIGLAFHAGLGLVSVKLMAVLFFLLGFRLPAASVSTDTLFSGKPDVATTSTVISIVVDAPAARPNRTAAGCISHGSRPVRGRGT